MMSSVGFALCCSICARKKSFRAADAWNARSYLTVELINSTARRRKVARSSAGRPRSCAMTRVWNSKVKSRARSAHPVSTNSSINASDRPYDLGFPTSERPGLEGRGHQIAVFPMRLARHCQDGRTDEQADRVVVVGRTERVGVPKGGVHQLE
jgi:hypothetical protein